MRTLLILAALMLAVPARADSWTSPQVREVFSESRAHFVRVTPGESWGDTFGFKGAKKGVYATAEFYRRAADGAYRPTAKVTLPHPVAPVQFFVSNDGRLVTLDNWHNVGYGTVIAVFAADGTLVKSHTLADLFSPAEIEAFPHSVSSIHWHSGPTYIKDDQRTLYLMIRAGADMMVSFESGRFMFCETRDRKYLCRDSNGNRTWRPYDERALPR